MTEVISDEGVLIVGTGQAAFQLAGFLREEGYAGRIRLVGEEAHLPYQRPPLSKAYMSGECQVEGLTFQSHEYYGKQGIELILATRIVHVDREARFAQASDGRRLFYSHLVFATGARNRRLAAIDDTQPGVLNLRNLDDAAAIRDRLDDARRIVVVGAGFLGLEFAAVAVSKGANVTVIETAPSLMGRAVSAPVGGAFRTYHAALGVEFALGTTLTGLQACAQGGYRVETADGRVLDADLVVVSVGVLPNSDLAEQAGLRTDNGIVVDEFLATEDPSISAIGDCAAFRSRYAAGGYCRIESVQNAMDQARCVARRIAGRPAPYDAVPWFWSDQGGLKLQIAGLSVGTDEVVLRGDEVGRRFSAYCFRQGQLVAVESVARPTDHMTARRLLGAGVPVTPDQVRDAQLDLKGLLPPPKATVLQPV